MKMRKYKKNKQGSCSLENRICTKVRTNDMMSDYEELYKKVNVLIDR